MKVNSTVLTHFLNRCVISTHGMNNKSIISMPDMLLVAEGDKMMMEGVSPAGNLQVEFNETLSVECEREEYPIVDTVLLHKLINSEFDNEDLEVSMVGNDIVFTSEMTTLNFPTTTMVETMGKFPEASEKLGDNKYGRVNFETCITINSIALSKAIGSSGATYSLYVYNFIVENGKFSIEVKTDDKGSVVKKTISTVDGPDVSAKYGAGIDNVFKHMVGDIKLQFNLNTPMLATDEADNRVVFFPLDI